MRYRKKGQKVKAKPLPVEITEEEFTLLVAVVKKDNHKIAFLLAWGSGLRISEVINLKQGDFNFQNKSIRVNLGKNSKDRIVPIPKGFKEHHLRFIPIGLGSRALQKSFKQYLKVCGVLDNKPKARFHSLRHGFATHCIRKGISLPHVQKLLGHEDLQTTSIYINLNPKESLNQYQDKF